MYADELGFDGIMLNEHHSTPSCMNAATNLSAAVLARITHQAKILLLGNILPIHDNPIRLAEELAMIDVISGGRLISGFVRGTGVETVSTNNNPVANRERFEECHDLVIKTWTTPGPFRWEGKHYNFRVVNPWMVPIQKPHPPIWVPGTSSPETAEWSGRHGYTYVAFLTDLDVTEELFGMYTQAANAAGREAVPDNFGYLLCCYVGDTRRRRPTSRPSTSSGAWVPPCVGRASTWRRWATGPPRARPLPRAAPASNRSTCRHSRN